MAKDKIQRRIDATSSQEAGVVTVESEDVIAEPAPPSISAPTNLQLDTLLSRSASTPTALITATWDIPGNVEPTKYAVRWSTDSTFPATSSGGQDALTDSTTIDNLTPGVLYYVQVAALYRSIQSPWSDTASITTENDTTPAGPPINFAVNFTATGDLAVTWRNPTASNFKDVEVTVWNAALTRSWRQTTPSESLLFPASLNLQYGIGPSVVVEVRSRTFNNIYSGTVSASAVKAKPATPTGLLVDFTGPAATFRWNTVAGAVVYRLSINNTLKTIQAPTTSYVYSFDENRADHGVPQTTLTYTLDAVDGLQQVSTSTTIASVVNLPPSPPTAIVANAVVATVGLFITAPKPSDFAGFVVRVLRDGVEISQYRTTNPDGIYTASGRGVYRFGAKVEDVFGQQSTELLTGGTNLDFVTTTDIRADATYTDSISTPSIQLAVLKDESEDYSILYT